MSPDTRVDDIADALRQRILSGEFGTGGRLPSHRMFAEQFGTTHETINKVIQQLQAEGLVSSLGRAGVFVRASRTRIPASIFRFDEYVKQTGLEPVEATIGTPAMVPAAVEVARALGIPENTPVIRRLQRQGTTTAHYRLVESFYPVTLAGGSILDQMHNDEHFDVLSAIKEAHGKAVRRVREDVIGRLPTQNEQDLLKIVRGTPVLEVHRTHYAEDDTPAIMYSRSILVASYFVLSYNYYVSPAS
jgi:DNA-binding GntR family transcriptional regulator